jgi:hypothetical protein
MTKTAAFLIAAALCAVPLGASAASPKLPELESQVHCALVFGQVTREQSQKLPGSDRFPAMAGPAREFFVVTGARTLDEKAATLDTIEAYYLTRLAVLQDGLAKAPDPAAELDREFAQCLPQFQAVAPEVAPKLR